MRIEPFSMKVTPEQSRIVQEFLFANGYTWASGRKNVSYLNYDLICFTRTYKSDIKTTLGYNTTDGAPSITFEEFKNLYMTPKTLEITPDKVLSAANKCPQAKEVLKEMFPELFEDDKSVKVSHTDGFIAIRNNEESEYHGKSFWLSKRWNWEIKEDSCGSFCLVPTKRD